MILAVDTDVLVSWAMQGTTRHRASRRLLEREVRDDGGQLGVTMQVLLEFVHVSTDPRRFRAPLPMEAALRLARAVWDGREVVRLLPGPTVMHRSMELLDRLRLGRKRILDTVLAATLEAAGVERLATFNRRDYAVFPFLKTVAPE